MSKKKDQKSKGPPNWFENIIYMIGLPGKAIEDEIASWEKMIADRHMNTTLRIKSLLVMDDATSMSLGQTILDRNPHLKDGWRVSYLNHDGTKISTHAYVFSTMNISGRTRFTFIEELRKVDGTYA